MSTRSFVGVMLGDVCRAIYVHYDGYIEGVGARLQEYTTQADVEKLIEGGDRGTLTCDFYGESPEDFNSFDEFFETVKGSWGEWYYIFKDGAWYCGTTYSPTYSPVSSADTELYKKLVPVAQELQSRKLQCLVS